METGTNIGLGMAAIGRPQYINVRAEKVHEDFSPERFRQRGLRMLDYAYDQGLRFFDTSPGYGMAESILSEWLRDKDDATISVATKWGMSYVAGFDPKAKVHEVKEHTLERLNAQWASSQILLPHLETYQIHSATLDTGVLDNREVLLRLYEIGQEHKLTMGLTATGIHQVGIIEKAMDITIGGKPLFQSFQCTYNIMEQSILRLKTALESGGRQLILKESLANGRLMPNPRYSKHSALYLELERLAQKYDVGTDAVALRFCMDSFPGAICLSGASTQDQLCANLQAQHFRLEQDEMEQLHGYAGATEDYWYERQQLPWQ